MIQASELRLNNWITNGDEPFQVTELDEVSCNIEYGEGGGHSWIYSLDDCYGIPLTTEILIACGFELLPGTRAMYRIFINDLEISISTELSFAYIDSQWGQASIKNPIFKYLHQVQNLVFSLTNQELIYKP